MTTSTFVNTGFEEAGTNPGEAVGWSLSTVIAEEGLASFGPAPRKPWEDLEGEWTDNEDDVFAFSSGNVEQAQFAAPTTTRVAYEGFEKGWSNDDDAQELVSVEAARFYPAPPWPTAVDAETFGGPEGAAWADWNAARYATGFASTDLTAAAFSGNPVETFAVGWRSNENDEWAFTGGDLTVATFGEETGLRVNREGFEAVSFPLAFFAVAASNTLDTTTDHGFSANDHVYLTNVGGALPTPLDVRRSYYVLTTPTTHTVTLSETAGGAEIDLLDVGTGDHAAYRDLSYYWKDELET